MRTSGRQVLEIGIWTEFSSVFQYWKSPKANMRDVVRVTQKDERGSWTFRSLFQAFPPQQYKMSRFMSGTFLLWFTRLHLPRQAFIISFSSHRSRFPMSIWVPANQSIYFFWHSTAFFLPSCCSQRISAPARGSCWRRSATFTTKAVEFEIHCFKKPNHS